VRLLDQLLGGGPVDLGQVDDERHGQAEAAGVGAADATSALTAEPVTSALVRPQSLTAEWKQAA